MVSAIPNPEPMVYGIPNLDLRIPKSYKKSGIPVYIPEVVQHFIFSNIFFGDMKYASDSPSYMSTATCAQSCRVFTWHEIPAKYV